MEKVFKVAGHKFSIIMPDGNMLWNEMQNFEPFLTDAEGGRIFSLELIDAMPDTSDKKRIGVGGGLLDMPREDIYEWQDKWLLEIAPNFEAPVRTYLITDKAFREAQFRILGGPKFSLKMCVMLMFIFATAQRNTLLIHSSVTMKDGKGYLFLGQSGTGKSTHSQLWINNIEGCELLNDDCPAIRFGNDGVLRVYGTPWSGKTPCYRDLDAPVGAFVNLHQAKKNAIRSLSVPEALAALWVAASRFRFTKELDESSYETEAKVACSAPFFSLDCLPDADAAFLCYNTIAK